ncbi:LPS-assembly lipoprotein LptE [Neiella marina]|uniref:LPS-assembly lipoprotein LptE n=1 Tax=Neiella marina TaxID=508461 RepID=A0A8J2U5G2_9GAMM|nr:LPS assembly lipoprotein LptE [Neiella marina]GGA78706.1 LPS-assembly lipoprotein LptE [Neiella marina]
MLKRWLFPLVLCTLLSACGFQLRGSYTLPDQFQQLHLQVQDPYAAISREVSKRFKDSGIVLLDVATDEAPRVILGKDRLERTNLSVYPDGQVAEYRLVYRLNVNVIQPGQKPKKLDLQVQRDYLDDPRQALAKRREREILLQEMREQISFQLLAQLSSL